MTQRVLFLLAFAFGPTAALAQGFTTNPGLSPTQERILNPIPFPPPAPAPSPPVPMIVPPAPVVSAPPPLTVYSGGSGPPTDPVDRRDRMPREPAPAVTLTAPPSSVTDKPADPNGIHWQTVTLPPAPDFTRGMSRDTGAGTDGVARARIEADGYRQVTGLAKGVDGLWRGKAMRGNSQVTVRVDARGNVSAE